MSSLAEAVVALGYGVASALVPIVNAEAFAVVAGQRGGHALVAVVVALALGQTAGKLLLFESARRGSGRLARRVAKRGKSGRAAARAARWTEPIRRWLSRRRTALPTVLASAAVGVPPLAVVSLAAGTAGLRRWEFAVACLSGRVIRFAVLVLPAVLA
ncbi:VTT domain-containing protein [Micromonospora sp. NBC_00362]|uniref:VTT domain-containing protein n=1 Tax=unclassified Micromonospora TaxID=2617518 RepID=UPI002251C3B9|nr:VTT domain-containing protein [Micromonospora sp. NBC_00362]MCX5117868.1 VTT domain-containing protein [Micromonospora sp. NBC_00362]WTI10066.1 VTT domain-containing protein [Micromonospora sp. NBC_00821]